MSFGGGGSMNLVLRNNKNMLNTRLRFENVLISFSPKVKRELNFIKASPQVLREIRWRMREENRKRQTKIIIAFGIVMVALITCLVYLENNYNQMLSMI